MKLLPEILQDLAEIWGLVDDIRTDDRDIDDTLLDIEVIIKKYQELDPSLINIK